MSPPRVHRRVALFRRFRRALADTCDGIAVVAVANIAVSTGERGARLEGIGAGDASSW